MLRDFKITSKLETSVAIMFTIIEIIVFIITLETCRYYKAIYLLFGFSTLFNILNYNLYIKFIKDTIYGLENSLMMVSRAYLNLHKSVSFAITVVIMFINLIISDLYIYKAIFVNKSCNTFTALSLCLIGVAFVFMSISAIQTVEEYNNQLIDVYDEYCNEVNNNE